jgi:D-inositol-3-phosphate glycosyltransferase
VRGARATLLPVVAESAGLAAIESIAAGTPVLATAVGALPELVGPAGVLVPPRDPERLATALRALWSDEQLVAGVVAAARERGAGAARTWEEVATATRRVYARVGVRTAR